MKQHFLITTALLALAVCLWNSCTKPTPFGSELLEEQLDSIIYTDTVSMRFFIEQEEDLITSDRSSVASYFLCGALQDPIFGRTESEIYSLFKLVSLNPNIEEEARFDSLVLFLNYNINGFYGDTGVVHTLRIQRLAEAMVYDSLYTAKSTVEAGEDICTPLQFYPYPTLSKNVFDTASTALKAPHLRVRMSDVFGSEMFAICKDSNAVETDSAFWDNIRGIKMSVSSPLDQGAMLAFSLNNNNVNIMRMYYTVYGTDTTSKSIDFNFTRCNKFMHFTHAYDQSPIASIIGTQSDKLLCLQGMTGLRLRVEFPYVDSTFNNISINKALLEFTAATLPGDRPILAKNPSDQLIAKVSQGDTLFLPIEDVDFSLAAVSNYSYFGGYPKTVTENGQTVQRYSLNLSQQFQKMIDGTGSDIKKRTLYLNAEPQRYSARRAVLYGPKSTVFPAKLILKYTKVE